MVRRTREEALATREQLLDAAIQVFRERGVGSTTLGEVADAAGVTRGAIYWHFRSKADLFEAMVERAELPLDSVLNDLEREALADPLAAVRDGALRALMHLAESPRMQAAYDVMFLRCEYNDEFQAIERRQLQERAMCIEHCRRALDLAVRRAQLPASTDTLVAAQGLYAFVSGLMRDWIQAPEGRDLKAAAPRLIDVYMAGLRANPPRRLARTRRTARAAHPGNGKASAKPNGKTNGTLDGKSPGRARAPAQRRGTARARIA